MRNARILIVASLFVTTWNIHARIVSYAPVIDRLISAFATLLNNSTNDPTYLPAALAAQLGK